MSTELPTKALQNSGNLIRTVSPRHTSPNQIHPAHRYADKLKRNEDRHTNAQHIQPPRPCCCRMANPLGKRCPSCAKSPLLHQSTIQAQKERSRGTSYSPTLAWLWKCYTTHPPLGVPLRRTGPMLFGSSLCGICSIARLLEGCGILACRPPVAIRLTCQRLPLRQSALSADLWRRIRIVRLAGCFRTPRG